MRLSLGFIVVAALSFTQAATLPRRSNQDGNVKERNIVDDILGALNGDKANAVTVTHTMVQTIRETVTVMGPGQVEGQQPPAAAPPVPTEAPQVVTVHEPLPPITVTQTLTVMQPCPVVPPAAAPPVEMPPPPPAEPIQSLPPPAVSAPPAASLPPPPEVQPSPPVASPPIASLPPVASLPPDAALPPLAPPAAETPPLPPLAPPAAETPALPPLVDGPPTALPITSPETATPVESSAPTIPPAAEVTPPVVNAPAVPGADLAGLTLTNELKLGNLLQQTQGLAARATPAAA